MSREAWGDPPDQEPEHCPLCDGAGQHTHDCELGAMQRRALDAESDARWMRAQLRHLVDELTVDEDDPAYPGLTRRVLAEGEGLLFSNMVNAVRGYLSASDRVRSTETEGLGPEGEERGARQGMRPEETNPWRDAVDAALVSAGLDCLAPDADPAASVRRLLEWHETMALDPAISERAQALIERGQASAPQVVKPFAGWTFERVGGGIVINSPTGSGVVVYKDDDAARVIPGEVLFELAEAILSAQASAPSVQVVEPHISGRNAIRALRDALRDMDAIQCPVSESGSLVGYFVNRLNQFAAQASALPAAQQPDPIGTKSVRADTLLDALSNNRPLNTDQRSALFATVMEADKLSQKFDAELERLKQLWAAQQPAVEPLFWISKRQIPVHLEGKAYYMPYRVKPEGLFQFPLYASPTAQPAASDVVADARRYRRIRDNPWSDELHEIITLHLNARWDAAIDAELDREGPKP